MKTGMNERVKMQAPNDTPKETAGFYAGKDDEYILRLARRPKGLRKEIIPVLVAELKRRNLDSKALIKWIANENNEFADTELDNLTYLISTRLCPGCGKNNNITGFINRYIYFGEIKRETILVCKQCGMKLKKKRLLTTLTLGLAGLLGVFILEGHRTLVAFLVPFHAVYQAINLLFHEKENDAVYKDFIKANTGHLRRSLSDDNILRLIRRYNRHGND
jgi:hypothetical protein